MLYLSLSLFTNLRCHCEHSGNAKRYPGRDRILVDPERYPGEHDDKNAWQIRLEDEVAYRTLQVELQ